MNLHTNMDLTHNFDFIRCKHHSNNFLLYDNGWTCVSFHHYAFKPKSLFHKRRTHSASCIMRIK